MARALLLLLAFVIGSCAPTVVPSPIPSSVTIVSPTPAASPPPVPTRSAPAPLASPPAPATTPATVPRLDEATASLIGALDAWCGALPPRAIGSVPLDLIGRLADGRSARETVAVLGRSSCGERLKAAPYGDGASEVVTVGGYAADGAVLWVDEGYWRIAPVPTDYGYLELRWDVRRENERELFFTIWSGGSGGAVGFLAIAIGAGTARVTLHTRPGASQMYAQQVDRDTVLVTGRKLPARPWGIASNCCLPGGHEWLWRWTAGGYLLLAERQAQDPYYAFNALLGAIDAGDPESAADVATPRAIKAASALLGPGRLWSYKASANAFDQGSAELLRWSALPGPAPIGPAVVQFQVARYEPAGPSVLITLERIGDRWMATDVAAGTLP